MKKFFSIIVILILGVITAQAAFLLLLHERLREQRNINKMILRLSTMKKGKEFKDSSLYDMNNPELEKAVLYYNRGEYHTSLPIFEKISKEGNANAKYFLARCYYYGQGTEKDYSIAIDLLGQNDGITLADANSLFLLSRCFRYGRGLSIDYEKADSLVIEAACRGLSDAIELLQIEKEMSKKDILDWLISILDSKIDPDYSLEGQEQERLKLEDLRKSAPTKDIKESAPKFGKA